MRNVWLNMMEYKKHKTVRKYAIHLRITFTAWYFVFVFYNVHICNVYFFFFFIFASLWKMSCFSLRTVLISIWRAYLQKGLDPFSWLRRKMRFSVRVCTRVYGKLNIEFTISSFCYLHSDQKCVLKVRGEINNVILVTRIWSKMDLTPFANELFICINIPILSWTNM